METKVKEYREKRGLTQEELSKLSGISRTTISDLENSKLEEISTKTMKALSSALKVNITTLFLS